MPARMCFVTTCYRLYSYILQPMTSNHFLAHMPSIVHNSVRSFRLHLLAWRWNVIKHAFFLACLQSRLQLNTSAITIPTTYLETVLWAATSFTAAIVVANFSYPSTPRACRCVRWSNNVLLKYNLTDSFIVVQARRLAHCLVIDHLNEPKANVINSDVIFGRALAKLFIRTYTYVLYRVSKIKVKC